MVSEEEELEGVTSLIEAHRAKTDRRERRQRNEGGGSPGRGFLLEEADSAEEVGVQVEVGKRRKVAGRGRFGGGSASAGEN